MSFETRSVRVNGACTYWSLGQVFDRTTLAAGFESLGLLDLTPEVRSEKSALSEAVREYYTEFSGYACEENEKLLFRPVDLSDEPEGTSAIAIVLETLNPGTHNSYTPLRTFKFRPGSATVDCGEPFSQAAFDEVNVLYRKHKQTVSQYAVAKALVAALSHFGGTSLRPSGAIYWIDETKLPQWESLIRVVENAGIEGDSKVYLLRTVFDDAAVRAVHDAIVHEIRTAAEEIEENARKPGLKERAFCSRRREAQRLHQRIGYFESILGSSLGELHACADRCEAEVVEAAIGEFPELFSVTPLNEA